VEFDHVFVDEDVVAVDALAVGDHAHKPALDC
jgi:hypothetical protein